MSMEATSQPERCAHTAPKDSKAPPEELAQQLKLRDFTQLQVAATLSKVFENLALREPDEIFKRAHEV